MRHIRDAIFNPDEDPQEWRQMLKDAMIPARYWDCTLGAIGDINVRKWVCDARSDMPKWMNQGAGYYLHGPFESGKSSLAALIGMTAIQRLQKVLWVGARDVPAAVFAETNEWKDANKKLRKCDLLILDDFGSQSFNMNGPAGTAYEAALRFIYDRKRSVIITANWGWEQFFTKYQNQLPALASIMERLVLPVEVVNSQWSDERRRNR